MKIYELEVSNFKSLENYGFPLCFSNLNLFIGENDSGKTALLEAIQVLFGYLNIKDNDFYNKEKEIKIKARLCDIRKNFLEDEMKMYDPKYEPDYEEFDDEKAYIKFEEEVLDSLKSYSFCEDLKKFYIDYKDNFTIGFEKIFKLEFNKIIMKKDIFYSYPLNQSNYFDNLMQNMEFLNFMSKEVTEINSEFNKYKKSDNYYEDAERTVFISEVGANSIPYRIARIINSRLYSECKWKIQEDLLENLLENETVTYSLSSILEPGEKLTTDKLGLGSFNPYINYFSTADLDIEKISNILYKDNFEVLLNLDKTKDDETLEREIYNFLNNSLCNYLLDKIFNQKENLGFYNEIKENLNILMNKLNTNKANIDFSFALQSPEKIEMFMQPALKITSLEGGREIDVGNKSQGYLRKLLISDFLLLTKNIGLENENGRILLIEEPEIHMHINAQKEIISVLKENLLEGNSQVFITTHSHTMIEGADLENIYVFRKEPASGITSIKNLRQISIFNREEILKEIIDSLGVKSTDLLFLKRMTLLLEGESDAAFIKGLCERPEISIDTEKILFKSASGQASIAYYAGLGEFLGLKTMIVYDNHELNKRDIENLKNNPYISSKLKNNVFKIEILEKPDILDYFDFEYVADYKGIPKEKIPQNNQNISMKEFLSNNNKWLDTKDVEYLAKSIPRIPKEFDKIISFLKLVLI